MRLFRGWGRVHALVGTNGKEEGDALGTPRVMPHATSSATTPPGVQVHHYVFVSTVVLPAPLSGFTFIRLSFPYFVKCCLPGEGITYIYFCTERIHGTARDKRRGVTTISK